MGGDFNQDVNSEQFRAAFAGAGLGALATGRYHRGTQHIDAVLGTPIARRALVRVDVGMGPADHHLITASFSLLKAAGGQAYRIARTQRPLELGHDGEAGQQRAESLC
eukprot:200157-Alexandrium_andersonii.AAC.1